MTLQKIISALTAVLFVGVTGTVFAASPSQMKSQIAYGSGDNPSQTQLPPDCKKNPTDPRCKDKK